MKSGRKDRLDVTDQRIDRKSLHQPPELFGRKVTQFIRIPGPGKVSVFNSLIEEKKTVAFP
jgi:hypothetical protein